MTPQKLSDNRKFYSPEVLGDKKVLRLYSDKPRKQHPNAYQLTVRKDKYIFSTEVYLSTEDLAKVNRFKQKRWSRMNAERERKESEQKIFRSFAINNFGVYNWDCFYKMPDRVQCAGEFAFEGATDLNDIKVFHVCGANGNMVVYYYDKKWDKFNFVPSEENQLLAVLPGNKIALFSKEDFAKLDLAQIKKTGKFKITFKETKTVKSVEDLKKLLM